MPSIIDELTEMGVLGDKVAPPAAEIVEESESDDDARAAQFGPMLLGLVEKIESIEKDVSGLKVAFNEAIQSLLGPAIEEQTAEQVDSEDGNDDQEEENVAV